MPLTGISRGDANAFRDGEMKKLFSVAEACFGPLEKLILRGVLLACTVIGALQLVGVKVDLPTLIHWVVRLSKHVHLLRFVLIRDI